MRQFRPASRASAERRRLVGAIGDDHRLRICTAGRVQQSGDLAKVRSRLNGKL